MAGLLDDGCMKECIRRPVRGLHEPEPFGRIEPLDYGRDFAARRFRPLEVSTVHHLGSQLQGEAGIASESRLTGRRTNEKRGNRGLPRSRWTKLLDRWTPCPKRLTLQGSAGPCTDGRPSPSKYAPRRTTKARSLMIFHFARQKEDAHLHRLPAPIEGGTGRA
jgi:hypothetical protein